MTLPCRTDSLVCSTEPRRATKHTKERRGVRTRGSRGETAAKKYAAHLYCDGSFRRDNGVSGLGVVVHYDRQRRKGYASKRLENSCPGSAEAEYEAVLYGLNFVESFLQNHSLLVMTDQRVVVDQLNLRCDVSKSRIKRLRKQVLDVAHEFPLIQFKWVSRTQNTQAHDLAKKASNDKSIEYDFQQEAYRIGNCFETDGRKHVTHLFCSGKHRKPLNACGVGVVVGWNRDKTIHHASKRLNGQYSQPVEVDYEAILYGLRFYRSLEGKDSVLVMTDEQSIINQLNHKQRPDSKRMLKLRTEILNIAATFPRVEFKCIAGEQNLIANKLARRASGGIQLDFEKKASKLVKDET